MKILPARNKLTGILGVTSQVRKSLKPGWAWMLCSFFSSDTSQLGAKWTFFSRTHRPLLAEVLMAFSAWRKPSAEPMAMLLMGLPHWAAISITRSDASKPETEHMRSGVAHFTYQGNYNIMSSRFDNLKNPNDLTSDSTMGARLSSGEAVKDCPMISETNFCAADVKRSGRRAYTAISS